MDVIVSGGWYRQPESLASDWKFEAFHFTEAGGAQMFAYDVDGDGDNDIITSLDAHGHGLAWFEQVRDGDQISFQRHLILGERPDENRYGVVFSELHALALADVDGDGLKDIVTGKTYWSHHTRTSSWHDGAVVFWFRLTRQGREVDFVPYQADDDSGIGRQVVVGDVNGDKSPDIVSANMKGTFVLLHQSRPVTLEEWTKAQPAPLALPPAGAEPVGSLPLGADGGALNLDFEDGTLKDWTSAGEAFAGQPVKGEIDPHRKFAEGKKANPQGQYWIGGFEKALDDKLQGMLTSASFVVTHPYASFRVGGGCQPGIRVELVQKETGKIIFQTHGRDSETMFPEVVDLSEHRGERIFVRLVDEESGGYGHLNFDDFRLHEKRPLFRESVAMPKKASK